MDFCSEFYRKSYLKLTDEQIQKHLDDFYHIGVYPLLKDNTLFLAADLTKDKFCKRIKPVEHDRHEMATNNHDRKERRSANSFFAKWRVQILIKPPTSYHLLHWRTV